MADKIIEPLKPGDKKFKTRLFLRTCVEQKKGKGNAPEVKLTLNDGVKIYPAKKWKVSEIERESIFSSQFLFISGDVDEGGDYHGEITILSVRSAEVTEIPDDISAYLSPCHQDHEEHLARFECLVLSVEDPNLRLLLETIFAKDKEIWPQYNEAHAAKKMHHAYSGGLLHHSVEVAELCASASAIIPTLSRDLLVACALLHDLGKIKELDHGLNAGEYTAAGILNGHISLGASRVRQFMNKIGFPPQLKESVTHMILSHHGVPEYGSPKLPMFAEAQVLAQCDLISARVFEYKEAAKNANGQLSVWLSGKENIQIYTGDLGLQKIETPLTLPKPVKEFNTTPPRLIAETPGFYTTRMRIRGLVAAGSPEQGSEEEQETREVVPPACGADFLVRVTGDSMTDEGIRERDLLFVKVIEAPKNGDIVVAHIGDSGEVVKRYRSDPTGTTGHEKKWLESENISRNYPNIPIDAETRIRGKVVGLLRDF